MAMAVLCFALSTVPARAQIFSKSRDSSFASQTSTGSGSEQTPTSPGLPTTTDPQSPCIQPSRIFIAEEYTGPMKHLVRYFVRKPEIKTVHMQRRYAGSRICALDSSEKFHLFLKNSINPVTFIVAGFYSGVAQAADDDPTFGQGAAGYGKRYGAALADEVSSDFFHTFAFPVIFRQDPRYYRQGYGTGGDRLKHAMTHVFVAHADGGGSMFNYSEWLGTTAAVALSNTYHPGNDRGVGPACESIAINIGTDVGTDILREFWPEIVRKFRLPFRVEQQPPAR